MEEQNAASFAASISNPTLASVAPDSNVVSTTPCVCSTIETSTWSHVIWNDKNHTGLCALVFVLIHGSSDPINSRNTHDSTMKRNGLILENIDDCGIKARTQAPTMTDHPPSHLTFPA